MEGFGKKLKEASGEKEVVPMEENAKREYEELFAEDYDGVEKKTEEELSILEFDGKKAYQELFAEDFIEEKALEGEAASGAEDASERVLEEENGAGKEASEEEDEIDLNQKYAPNSKIEKNGSIYETDDNGTIYKINGRELVPNITFTIGGVIYQTDAQGRIRSCEGTPKQTPDGKRDTKAQRDAGGEDREKGDQGGHILARILGGSEGIENILPMRGSINQGPYHEMENEINKALKDGKDVTLQVEIEYEGDSKRPSKITVTYTIDGKKTRVEFDNREGSTELLDSIADQVEKEQYEDLKQELEDAKKDGRNLSILAVKTEYDENGKVTKVTVVLRDEDSGTNEKRVLLPKEDAK